MHYELANDIKKYTTKINAQRVYIFLASLDSHLDEVHGCILITKPLPNLQAAYSMVYAEANRQDAMLGAASNEGAVMVVRNRLLVLIQRKVFISVLIVMVITIWSIHALSSIDILIGIQRLRQRLLCILTLR